MAASTLCSRRANPYAVDDAGSRAADGERNEQQIVLSTLRKRDSACADEQRNSEERRDQQNADKRYEHLRGDGFHNYLSSSPRLKALRCIDCFADAEAL